MRSCEAPCSPPCAEPARYVGLCRGHYRRRERGQPVNTPLAKRAVASRGEIPTKRLTTVQVTDLTYSALTAEAKKRGITVYALHQSIVEEWAQTALGLKT